MVELITALSFNNYLNALFVTAGIFHIFNSPFVLTLLMAGAV